MNSGFIRKIPIGMKSISHLKTGLNDDLVNGIYAYGINKVTPLQFRSLMASKTKHDFLIRSTNVNEMRVSWSMRERSSVNL
ncbi:hypothetical protein B4U80_08354 [Leptotrombidium deliense]|uniref:Uncharacterized protein n=1 Tax=Leptotrombidium deliense TaxID=299467 RepID=A0A443S3B3_9ACAR|nr:hypothetical protein B4U80_08354 [Leptotrombidium deliense]